MRLLLFDIDHTLINSGGAGRSAMAAAFADEFDVPSPLADIQIDGRTDRAIFDDALGRIEAEASAATFERMLESYLARLPEALRAHDGRVLDGVVELLDALALSPAAIGLATGNVARGAELKLRHFGLWERFSGGGFGDRSAERAEVVAAAISAVAKAAGVNDGSGDPLVIGDTPRDVTAAHAAGARTLAVASGAYDETALRASGADFVLPDLSDTEAVLAILLG